VVAIYSTFLSRAWDQVVYDVALHRLPVVIFCLDRAGITGDDGASHHGVYDMALLAKVPGMRVLAPSSAQELQQMLHDAISLADSGPVVIRYPRARPARSTTEDVGVGIRARRCARATVGLRAGDRQARRRALKAAEQLATTGIDVTVWDVRCCAPLDPAMIADAARHGAVVTVEDGIREGGIGMSIADAVGASSPRRPQAVPVRVLGVPDPVSSPRRNPMPMHPRPLLGTRRRVAARRARAAAPSRSPSGRR
jgi:1-deoxy-D-xylulose-5-phosphate synthase